MSLPKIPAMSHDQERQWNGFAPADIRDPSFLKDYYFRKFNTAKVQIVSTEEFYNSAILVAMASENRMDFARRFEKYCIEMCAEVSTSYKDLRRRIRKNGYAFPHCDILGARLLQFCNSPDLKSLQRILGSIASDREAADWVVDEPPLSDDGSDTRSTQLWHDDTSDDIHVKGRHMSEARSEASEASEASKAPTIESFGAWCEKHRPGHEQQTSKERPLMKRRRFDGAAAVVDDAVQPDYEYNNHNMTSSHQPPASTQRVTGHPAKKRRLTTRRIEGPMTPDQVAGGRCIKKGAEYCGDYDGCEHKRQRTKSWIDTATGMWPHDEPTDNEPGNPSTVSQKAVVEVIPREKSNTDDEDNATPTLHTSRLAQQTADESMPVTKATVVDDIKGNLNARSTRSAKASYFCELNNANKLSVVR
ncbi:hypothetical protein GGI42DRAFT_219223 [Trichoderma sp. SZMC 28013]